MAILVKTFTHWETVLPTAHKFCLLNLIPKQSQSAELDNYVGVFLTRYDEEEKLKAGLKLYLQLFFFMDFSLGLALPSYNTYVLYIQIYCLTIWPITPILQKELGQFQTFIKPADLKINLEAKS